jgi:hypothetical protein
MPEKYKRLTKHNDKGDVMMNCEECDFHETSSCTAYSCRQILMMRLAEWEDLAEANNLAPPKLGRWILVKYYRDEDGVLCPIFRCSKCGIPHFRDERYCPKCGAEMSNAGDAEEESKNG